MTGDPDSGEPPVDPLLGQQRMVDDPRISIAQAAVVLGKNIPQVRRLIAKGRLPRHGAANNFWPLQLSEVEALRDIGDPISLKDAARKLARSAEATRELVADGHLPLVPGTKTMVYPADVAAIAHAFAHPPIRRPVGPTGYISTKEAAERLGLTALYVSQMAAEEKLPAIFQDRQWWFDPQRIELIRRARRARRDRVVPRPLRRPRGSSV
jgi:excisionase family DNA binding protein